MARGGANLGRARRDHEKEGEYMNQHEELREFLIVVRRALLMVCAWIAKRYKLDEEHT